MACVMVVPCQGQSVIEAGISGLKFDANIQIDEICAREV